MRKLLPILILICTSIAFQVNASFGKKFRVWPNDDTNLSFKKELSTLGELAALSHSTNSSHSLGIDLDLDCSPRNVSRRRRANKQILVLSALVGYSSTSIELIMHRFMESLKDAGNTGVKVLIVGDANFPSHLLRKYDNLRYKRAGFSVTKKHSKVQASARFQAWAAYLNEYRSAYDYVFATDTSDVIFQTSLFDILNHGTHDTQLWIFAEQTSKSTNRDLSYVAGKCRKKRCKLDCTPFAKYPHSNEGTIFGEADVVTNLLNTFVSALKNHRNCWDQLVFQSVVYSQQAHSTICFSRTGPIVTFGGLPAEVVNITNSGDVYTMYGKATIIHQFNRVKTLNPLIVGKYAKST